MDFGTPDGTLLTFASTVAIGVASGIVPLVNAELYIVLLGTAAPRSLLPALLVVATLSHMVGKSVMYLAGRSLDRLPPSAFTQRVAAARATLAHRPALGGALVFTSALTGLPPFYAVAVGSGVVRYSFASFFVLGAAGRLLRFGALVFLPELARTLAR